MLGLREYVNDRAHFCNLTRVNHRHTVGNLLDDLHLVGNQDHGHAQLAVDLAQQVQDRTGGLGVQRRRGFVAQQHLGVGRQRACNAHTLLLAARDLCRIAVCQLRQAYQLQQRINALFDVGLGHARQLQRQRGVVIHGARRQQVEVLKHHANFVARGAQLRIAHGHQIAAIHDHLARCGAVEQIDAAHQRAFARARAADDAEDFTLLNGQVDVLERFDRPLGALVGQGQVPNVDHVSSYSTRRARQAMCSQK